MPCPWFWRPPCAVLWKVTPACADWIASPDNVLFSSGALGPSSAVLELGCGVSPLNALAFSGRVARYVLTDQPYVQKLVAANLAEVGLDPGSDGDATRRRRPARADRRGQPRARHRPPPPSQAAVRFRTLDWETDTVTGALAGDDDDDDATRGSFDAVLACDCVFNYALVEPFVQTCVDACRLRSSEDDDGARQPCFCIVAQQLRNDDVFQSWLSVFYKHFHVWRLPERFLPDRLRPGAGFVVHIGILRDAGG